MEGVSYPDTVFRKKGESQAAPHSANPLISLPWTPPAAPGKVAAMAANRETLQRISASRRSPTCSG